MEPFTASAWLTVLGLSGEAVVDAEQRPLVQVPVEPSHSVAQIKGWIGSKDLFRAICGADFGADFGAVGENQAGGSTSCCGSWVAWG